MKFYPNHVPSYDCNNEEAVQNVLPSRSIVRLPSSDDEGVFDLDLDDDSPVGSPAPSTVMRVVSRPVRGRFTQFVHQEEQVQRVKERLLNLTQSKLQSVDRSADGLRNKVLLEASLKRCLTQSSLEKKNKMQISFRSTPHESPMTNDQLQQLAVNKDLISPSKNRATSPPPYSPFLSKSVPSSPRKRTVRESQQQITTHLSEELDWSSNLAKKLKALHYEDMDTSGDLPMSNNNNCPSMKEDLFSDLASVFYRLKTQQ